MYGIKMIDRKFLRKKLVADNIRKRLDEMNLQQNELAEKIGMAPQQLSTYVLGKREPQEDNLIKIAAGLELKSPMELYRMSPEMMGEELAQAWNCLIDLDTIPDKMNIATRFLKLLVKTHKAESPPEILMAIEQLITVAEK
jgi:transcriptional regulator with XRE-family HTH domain